MRRLLFISPHFPPDSSAGSHRARLLAPRLRDAGWETVVLTVDERAYEARLDPALAQLVPSDLRVERVRAIDVRRARAMGVGDLGLRSLLPLRTAASRLLREERFDAIYITIYPSYPAVLGRVLSRRFGIPFVLDYQDPWVGAWGRDVGGGSAGEPDLRSRVTRAIAQRLEPWTLARASGVTAVSSATWTEICQRTPAARALPFLELPIGADPADMVAAEHINHAHFDRDDGLVHLCYVGTVLPLGEPAVRAVMEAVALLRRDDPSLASRIRLHFFGTSNQTGGGRERVMPIARTAGVADVVSEVTGRVDYLEALAVQRDAHGVLLLGSTEPHYTPSKLYPALMTGNPIVALYHPASSARTVLDDAASERVVHFIAIEPEHGIDATAVARALGSIARAAAGRPGRGHAGVLPTSSVGFSAQALAARLGAFLDDIVEAGA